MSTAELKEELQKAINSIPENAPEGLLHEVLVHIHDVNAKITEKAKRAKFVQDIIAEDEEVFRKLAQ